MLNDEIIIQQTMNWVHHVIVGLNFCPFAGREVERNTIRYVVDRSSQYEHRLHHLIDECLHLDINTQTETTLFIIAEGLNEFESFLDFIALADTLLKEQRYEGVYQLAHFHPHYQFENTDNDDASNYTNRSPYPMLHLIRETSIERAIEHYPDAETIPERNIELARKKGKLQMQALLDAALKDH
jgi:hypothetical protein